MTFHAECLLDGKQHPSRFHACANEGEWPRSYNIKVFKRMGDGVVYAIDGKRQRGIKRYTFYRLRDDRPEWAK